MEFIPGSTGQITPDPEAKVTEKDLAQTQAAMDFFAANAERIKHFKQRAEELGRNGNDTVIALINVDDPKGSILADALMPAHNWQQYRDAGEVPVARGLALKEGVQEFLEMAGYDVAARELSETSVLSVVVLDANVALVLDVDFNSPES